MLARANVGILDIGQAVIHDTLSFGILVEMSGDTSDSDVLKDVLFRGYELDQQVRFTPDRKSTRLNSSHVRISYAVFCLKKKKKKIKIKTHDERENKKEIIKIHLVLMLKKKIIML